MTNEKEILIRRVGNGFVVELTDYSTEEIEEESFIASNEAELRVQVIKLMEKLYPDPIYADDFVAKEAK